MTVRRTDVSGDRSTGANIWLSFRDTAPRGVGSFELRSWMCKGSPYESRGADSVHETASVVADVGVRSTRQGVAGTDERVAPRRGA
jgi:hypothetical protein